MASMLLPGAPSVTEDTTRDVVGTDHATTETLLDLEEIFEQLGVGTERLKMLSACEQKAFMHQVDDENELPIDVRRQVLKFISFLLERFGATLPQEWFKVVAILDILATRLPMRLEDLPDRCAAMVSIVRKADTAEAHPWLTEIAEYATGFSHSLRAREPVMPGMITRNSIHHQEKLVLDALGWQVEPASCETWISAFCTRFSVVEKECPQPCIHWIWQNSISCAQWICMRHSASKALQPRCLAQGIVGISAVMAHLVPCQCLQPDRVELHDWLQLFSTVGAHIMQKSQFHHQCLSSLLLAMDKQLGTLKEDTHDVLKLIQDMNHEGRVGFDSVQESLHG